MSAEQGLRPRGRTGPPAGSDKPYRVPLVEQLHRHRSVLVAQYSPAGRPGADREPQQATAGGKPGDSTSRRQGQGRAEAARGRLELVARKAPSWLWSLDRPRGPADDSQRAVRGPWNASGRPGAGAGGSWSTSRPVSSWRPLPRGPRGPGLPERQKAPGVNQGPLMGADDVGKRYGPMATAVPKPGACDLASDL